MATFKRNALTKGASGSFEDEFVFRQVNGRTIITSLPKKSDKTSSPAQLEARKKFINASLYAKSAMANPAMKAEYAAIAQFKNLKSTTVAAMTDFLTSTQLEMTYAHQFDGSVGFPITIVLADNYKGKEMTVAVSNKDGTITESGNASFAFGDSAWRYITKVAYPNLNTKDDSNKITIMYSD